MKLAQNINLTHRYYLWRASRIKGLSERSLQVARLMGIEELFRVPFFLVGQEVACTQIISTLIGHVGRGYPGSREPLVLLFAGPSGHGKTELAQHMGDLLGVPFHIVDCTSASEPLEVLGPRKPYMGYEEGAPLNNFLAENSGERCVVLLDEIEKTSPEVHQAFLLIFESGGFTVLV